jgi:hypothetical protein
MQDFNIMVLKTLFTCGTYVHWRNFMTLWAKMFGKAEQQGLVLEQVSPNAFGVPGCRSSWWMTLDSNELKGAPPAKASCVLLFLHGETGCHISTCTCRTVHANAYRCPSCRHSSREWNRPEQWHKRQHHMCCAANCDHVHAGGAFMAGDPRMYCPAFKHWMRALAAQGISMRVLSVGYPLAPENTFPAPVLAAAAAYRWLLDQLKAEGRNDAVIMGESWQLLDDREPPRMFLRSCSIVWCAWSDDVPPVGGSALCCWGGHQGWQKQRGSGMPHFAGRSKQRYEHDVYPADAVCIVMYALCSV